MGVCLEKNFSSVVVGNVYVSLNTRFRKNEEFGVDTDVVDRGGDEEK